MKLPFFYARGMESSQGTIPLDAETSRHIIQVLRMKVGEQLNLTDGRGNIYTCEIVTDDKKQCNVLIKNTTHRDQNTRKVTIAISILKNSNRFEWFLEKATEIGVNTIIPLICERTEKEKFRHDRMNAICISAMLQSQQCWLPDLREPVKYANMEKWKNGNGPNFIAHCIETEKQPLSHLHNATSSYLQICIGPEGDFTPKEIEMALAEGFIPVSLGETRLRTETAGIAAAVLLCAGR